MSKIAAAYTNLTESEAAGRQLGEQIVQKLAGVAPDAVLVFVSARFDYEALLCALEGTCHPKVLIGSSSAGEFTGEHQGAGTACALAICSKDMQFTAALGRSLGAGRAEAARQLVSSFRGLTEHHYPYRAAVVLSDALAGHADELVEQLTVHTSGKYQFVGGGAGDDAQFARTHVFCGTEAFTDAVVALEILSLKPLGVGVQHGWVPGSGPLRVTAAEGARLVSINGFPAVEAFEAYAEETGQQLERSAPLPFFLHNILGVETHQGHRLRVPLSVQSDGSVSCAAEIPVGATVHIMKTSTASSTDAAASAARSALQGLADMKPGGALFFDCVATRLRMGDAFGLELDEVTDVLAGAELVGCNTYGQIARGEGQFGGFHNCTAVVLILPA